MKLNEILSQQGVVLQSPSDGDIRNRARDVQPVKLFYGETYDDKGETLDSMKYYFFVDALSQSLLQEGFETDPVILVADTAACRNVSRGLERIYMKLGEERARFVETVNDTYGTGLRVVKMSEYISTPEFQEHLRGIIETCRDDSKLMEAVERTVPESKLEIERSRGFGYSFDEIATIIDLDVKIGPPREDLYDGIAREIARRRKEKELMSLFLTPTFPLGKRWDYFFSNEGIEDHGITAYKGGSKRLQGNRILIGKTRIEYAENLIDASFMSENPVLPNPVLDAGIITEMAKRRLKGDDSPITLADDFYSGRLSQEELRRKVVEQLGEYVLSQF
ncbi:MAG: hypothetical protein KKG75_05440 [Nanoarchaeota archaeon]|nr:hypothetical protein [Nanoarchaeota archaeon]